MVSCEKVNSVLGDVGKGENKACSYFALILQGIEVLASFRKKGLLEPSGQEVRRSNFLAWITGDDPGGL